MPMVWDFLATNNPNFQLHPSVDGPNPEFDPCTGFPYLLSGPKSTLLSYCLSTGLPHGVRSDAWWSYCACLTSPPPGCMGGFQVSFKQPACLHTSGSHLPGFRMFLSKSHSSPCFSLHPLFSLPCLLQRDVLPLHVAAPPMPFGVVTCPWPTRSVLLDDGDQA